MLFKSTILAQASGSLDGTVFSHNRGGRYTRRRAIPTDPKSTTQLQRRLQFGSGATWWQAASASTRNGWDTYAANTPWVNRLGDTTFLTGQQQAMRVATILAISGEFTPGPLLIGQAPTDFRYPDVGNVTITTIEDDGTITLAVDGSSEWRAAASDGCLVFAGLPQNPSRNYYGGPWRFLDTHQGNATPVTTMVDNVSEAVPSFPLTAGQKMWIRLVCYVENAVNGSVIVSRPKTIGPSIVIAAA